MAFEIIFINLIIFLNQVFLLQKFKMAEKIIVNFFLIKSSQFFSNVDSPQFTAINRQLTSN
jgi:hypothetical protein